MSVGNGFSIDLDDKIHKIKAKLETKEGFNLI